MTSPKISGQNSLGFTLIEIIVVLAILAGLLSLGFFINTNSLTKTTFTSERELIVSLLMRARSMALSGVRNENHGICFIKQNYILFDGNNCQVAAPESVGFEANELIAQNSEFTSKFPVVIFEKNTGNTTEQKIIITDGLLNEIISINNEGRIDW